MSRFRWLAFIFAGVLSLGGCSSLALLVFDTRIAQPGRLPSGWRIKVNRGTPDVEVIHDGQGNVLRLKSQAASFALERALDVDPSRYPYLSWRWKVTELPSQGDFRHLTTDDQAAQILVAFGDRRILSYIWDSSAPKDSVETSGLLPLIRISVLVCQSGRANLNQWLTEVRDVNADYTRAFGRAPAHHVKGIRIQINSQHTGASAESYFGDVGFHSTL